MEIAGARALIMEVGETCVPSPLSKCSLPELPQLSPEREKQQPWEAQQGQVG